MMAAPRRTCPACQRRYAGLVAPECPVCSGMGVLALGAAALHHHEAAAVAKAVDLYLEHASQEATRTLALGDRRQALEAATDELRVAGILATSAETYTRPVVHTLPDAEAESVLELDADQIVRQLGRPSSSAVRASLARRPVDDLGPHRPRLGGVPTASTNGHLSALAVIADPIDPIGPDVVTYTDRHRENTYTARVLVSAVPEVVAMRGPQLEQAVRLVDDTLANVGLDDLKRATKALGLPLTSNKLTLARRLLDAGHTIPQYATTA